MNNEKSILDLVKPLKNMDTSELSASLRGNSLSMCRESLSLKINQSFCSWATLRDNFFVTEEVHTWYSLLNSIVTYHCLNSF